MEVNRKDLFDFVVILTEAEFATLKRLANKYGNNVEQQFATMYSMGYVVCCKESEESR